MNEPNEEQIKKFWEWCGLWYEQPYWLNKDCANGQCCFYGEYYQELLRTITLNNLFKYAVPKLYEIEGFHVLNYQFVGHSKDIEMFRHSCLIVFTNAKDDIYECAKDPALALFWAIYKVMELK